MANGSKLHILSMAFLYCIFKIDFLVAIDSDTDISVISLGMSQCLGQALIITAYTVGLEKVDSRDLQSIKSG